MLQLKEIHKKKDRFETNLLLIKFKQLHNVQEVYNRQIHKQLIKIHKWFQSIVINVNPG